MLVQLRKVHQDMVIRNTVEETHRDDRKDSPEGIPEQQVGILEDAANLISNSIRENKLSDTHY